MKETILLTFDVEEYYQVENLRAVYPKKVWKNRSSGIEKNLDLILQILNEFEVKATFFILGLVADKYPGLIRQILNEGHEVASHGYGHDHSSVLDDNSLIEDIRSSKYKLEDICGTSINGYRAPNFSVSDRILNILKELDFRYDSSYNPFQLHSRYGTVSMKSDPIENGILNFANGIKEIPISVCRFGNLAIPDGGGAYFRIMPFHLFYTLVKQTLDQTGVYHMYLHPWEFEHDQPKASALTFNHKFRHYYGLKKTEQKFRKLLSKLVDRGCRFQKISEFANL